eukprot:scpid42070/ scgid7292/ Ficolin-1; Ficolin-A; Ficolin-alpha
MTFALALHTLAALGILLASRETAVCKSIGSDVRNESLTSTDASKSCMSRLLLLLPVPSLNIQNAELLLKSITPPSDELTVAQTNPVLLSAILGGEGAARRFTQCLTGDLGVCRTHHPCHNAGKCVYTSSAANQGSYQCQCDAGHTGQYCEQELPSCASNPCQNGAKCQPKGASFRCLCPLLFSGRYCENKWFDETTFQEQSSSLQKVSSDMQRLKQNLHAARQEDVGRIQAFLGRLEKKVEASLNSSMASLSERVNVLGEGLNALREKQDARSSRCERNDTSPSGVFVVHARTAQHTAYCDRETDGGGWTVFQRRQDGSVDFYRTWDAYKRGFGAASGEFWLGLDMLHSLTSQAGSTFELRIDMVFSTTGEKHFVKYSSFRVDSEAENYRLHVSGFSSPTLQDRMSGHSGHPFSTHDRDNDDYGGNCALYHKGGWWYTACHALNLNGAYGRPDGDSLGAYYYTDDFTAIQFVEMKIRLHD